jgi:hypothetical protein
MGGTDYREMPLAQAMFGHFWKNPMICEESGIFDDLFGGLDETGRLVLVCLSGGFLEKCKSRNEPGEDVKVQKLKRDESYQGLAFTRGSYQFIGDCISFQTVNSCHFAEVMTQKNVLLVSVMLRAEGLKDWGFLQRRPMCQGSWPRSLTVGG